MRHNRIIVAEQGAPVLLARFHTRALRDRWALIRRAIGLLALLRDRWQERREMRHLALFEPDSVLEDAGVRREEAWRRALTPLWRP